MEYKDRLARIIYMEKIYDELNESVLNLRKAAEQFVLYQDKFIELEEYYEGGEWMEDFLEDEKGNIPKDIKRGILSEDAIYDLFIEKKELFSVLNTIISK